MMDDDIFADEDEESWDDFINALEISIEQTKDWMEETFGPDQAIHAVPLSEYEKVVQNNLYLQKQLLELVKLFTEEE